MEILMFLSQQGIATTGGGSAVGFGTTVALASGGSVTIASYPYVEVLVVDDLGIWKHVVF